MSIKSIDFTSVPLASGIGFVKGVQQTHQQCRSCWKIIENSKGYFFPPQGPLRNRHLHFHLPSWGGQLLFFFPCPPQNQYVFHNRTLLKVPMWTRPCGKLVSCAVSNLWIPACLCRGTEWHKRFLQIRWHPRRGKALETAWKMTWRRVLEGVILKFDVLKTSTWISGAPLEDRHCHLLHLSGDVKVVADCCKKWGGWGGVWWINTSYKPGAF